jgi:peptide/nickel transport system substrate-binding protein
VDYKRFDTARRKTANVHELELVEAYAQGKLSRRHFIKRGTVIGLSLPFMSSVIAACGGDAEEATTTTAGGGGDTATTAAPTATTTPGAAASGGVIRVAIQRPITLDPVLMQDLGSYGMIAQSFEFLCTLDSTGADIAPGLAESWSPNDDGSVWTFNLRQGATWQDGSPFTSADVVATMERLVEAGNSALNGVLSSGGTVAIDDATVEFSLDAPNGNFPYLVSVFNAQSPITPANYEVGTTLDGTPNGTGAWKIESFDTATGARFVRSDSWWGGQTALDAVEFTFFDETGPMITAYQGGQIDAIVQFDVITGNILLNDPNFAPIATQTALHRQIWMRTDTGQFADKRVRQALALTLNRQQMVDQLFQGRADIGNDHVIAPVYPFYDPSTPAQRERNIEQARALLAEAGAEGLTATLQVGELQEIPDLAVLIASGAQEAGITINVAVEPLDTFYGNQWCPAEPADPPCSGAAELGIVDYGHRATPDIFLNAALSTGGVWNSSQYNNPDFDAAFAEYSAAIGLEAQTAACTKIQTILNDEVPVAVPFFYNYLAGNSTQFQGVYSSALGQMFFSSASQAGVERHRSARGDGNGHPPEHPIPGGRRWPNSSFDEFCCRSSPSG